MAALSSALDTLQKDGLLQSYKIATNVKIWKGALVGTSGGYLKPMAHGTASMSYVGVAYETVDNTGGADGAKSVRVMKAGTFVFNPYSGYTPAQTDVGAEIYAVTDNEIQTGTSGLTNQYKVGAVVEYISASKIRIRVDNYVK